MKLEPEKFKELWLLLREDPLSLDDDQIREIIAGGEELSRRLWNIYMGLPRRYEAVLQSRSRRLELEQLSTEKLKARQKEINCHRSAEQEADWSDDLPDSFFEAPPIDSDEHIVDEILEERAKQPTTPC